MKLIVRYALVGSLIGGVVGGVAGAVKSRRPKEVSAAASNEETYADVGVYAGGDVEDALGELHGMLPPPAATSWTRSSRASASSSCAST